MDQSSEPKQNPCHDAYSNSLLSFLHSLLNASKDLQNNSLFITHNPEPYIESLLRFQDSIFFTNPKLSQLFSTLKTLLQKHKNSHAYTLNSLIRRQVINYRIYQVADAIGVEVQACIDQEIIRNLVEISHDKDLLFTEDEKLRVLKDFENRLLLGFDGDFQELILKAKVFSILESLLCDSTRSKWLREEAANCIVGLVEFNRNVFVGLVLMGPIIECLVSMASSCSMKVLSSLVRLIKTPLIDELEVKGEIVRIVGLLNSKDLEIQVATLDCICEIAFLGRKEVIEAMIHEGLVEKLMELQRSRLGDNLLDAQTDEAGENGKNCEEARPFTGCVNKFAVQIEVGEGLDQKERQELKMEVLKRIKENSVCEAECASIVAEVLWGSSAS